MILLILSWQNPRFESFRKWTTVVLALKLTDRKTMLLVCCLVGLNWIGFLWLVAIAVHVGASNPDFWELLFVGKEEKKQTKQNKFFQSRRSHDLIYQDSTIPMSPSLLKNIYGQSHEHTRRMKPWRLIWKNVYICKLCKNQSLKKWCFRVFEDLLTKQTRSRVHACSKWNV